MPTEPPARNELRRHLTTRGKVVFGYFGVLLVAIVVGALGLSKTREDDRNRPRRRHL